jgi:DNA mismatch repair protein MutS2
MQNKTNIDTLSTKSQAALGWPELLSHLAHLCHTARGQAAARALPLLDDEQAVERELELVAQARALHDQSEPLPFGSVSDLAPALVRLRKEGALEGPDLLQVAETLEAGARLRNFLMERQERCPELSRLASGIAPLWDVSGPIRDSFDDRGELSDEASPELARLRRRCRELHDALTRSMRSLMEEPEVQKWLQDKFYTQRQDRYVLPVRADSSGRVEGIVHGSSASGQTVFVEPEVVVATNNKLKVAELEVLREELRIFLLLSNYVREELPAVEQNLELLEQLDLVDARARLAVKLDAGRPRISPASDQVVELLGARHPLMLLAGSGAEVVPNDLRMEPGQALIVTGPNAGGKTVCLKTTGILSLMLRGGMHLPAAPDSRMPLYSAVFTEMGDDQSLEQSLSTFTAHLQNLLDFLQAGKAGVLLLLDEVGVGTDPREGAALAQALLEGMVETGAQLLVTTHFERLKTLPLTDPRFVNASVGFDLEAMRPTFRLGYGLPGTSGALDVARRLGLASELAERAAGLLSGEGQDLAVLLGSLSNERTRLEEAREAAARERDAAATERSNYQRKLERLNEQGQKALGEAHQKALNELKGAREMISRMRTQLRGKPSKERLAQAERRLSDASRKIREQEEDDGPAGTPARPEDLKPGTRVVVASLGGEGKVLEAPRRGKVTVQAGAIRTQVKVEDVFLPEAKKKKPAVAKGAPVRMKEKPALATETDQKRELIRTSGNTLDLRGFRVLEAMAILEKFLDDAMRAEEDAVWIIHGHGTGAMKAAVREKLAEMPYVADQMPAEPRDGGDGVTVALIL